MLSARKDGDPIIKNTGSPSQTRGATIKVLSRNVDQVVLGNLLFKTWYFSPYPDAVIFGPDYHAPKPTAVNGEHKNGHTEIVHTTLIPVCYVCQYCFKYTTSSADYAQHCRKCLDDGEDEWKPVPKSAEKVYEWDGYTVWDIDGEREKLYCQNLSLFAKLFLEQKSVFFDTSGFHYFVLTHESANLSNSPSAARGGSRRRSNSFPKSVMSHRVLGFFSKENLSWDANNLACILVFPPYQHRNLGQFLMAVSYKLSGWEWVDSVIGGPEKPLSAMGMKSYLRFWSERIARFFMGQATDAEGRKVFETLTTKQKRATFAREEMTIKEIGDRTGMLPEDVIAALNEMGICEIQSQKRKKQSDGMQSSTQPEESWLANVVVKRSAVLSWAERKRVNLVSPVHEEGFLGEWALSATDNEEDEAVEETVPNSP